jgi:hypothetical protein
MGDFGEKKNSGILIFSSLDNSSCFIAEHSAKLSPLLSSYIKSGYEKIELSIDGDLLQKLSSYLEYHGGPGQGDKPPLYPLLSQGDKSPLHPLLSQGDKSPLHPLLSQGDKSSSQHLSSKQIETKSQGDKSPLHPPLSSKSKRIETKSSSICASGGLKGGKAPLIYAPLRYTTMIQNTNCEWDAIYIDEVAKNVKVLKNLLIISDLLEIQGLLILCCARFALLIKGKPLEVVIKNFCG